MNAIPVRKRDFRAFLSHSSKDKKLIGEIHQWLTGAGISTWYDEDALAAGMNFVDVLGDAIPLCQSMMIMVSESALASGWVKQEYNFALNHQMQFSEFNVIPVILDGSEPPGFLGIKNHIRLQDGRPDMAFYYQLLRALYPGDIALKYGTQKDLYVSYGWRDSEAEFVEGVFRRFIQERFRLVGDYKDHPHFTETDNRVKDIMSSCGGLLAVAPYREQESAHGFTSKYIWKEIKLAQAFDLPCVLICEEGVEVPAEIEAMVDYAGSTPRNVNFDTLPELTSAIGVIGNRWREPSSEHYIFFATDFDNPDRNKIIMDAIMRITGMRCFLGENIRGGKQSVQREIVDRIKGAYFCIGDISADNTNTLIEMGIARGADVRYQLVAAEPRHRPPFMFRDNEVYHFETDAELLSIIHRIIYPYRRYIINYELSG
jgi:hypothetical protein